MSIKNLSVFPHPQSELGDDYQGMSLRDWFAGQRLASVDPGWFETVKQAAEYCYECADAMLAARQREEPQP